MHWSYVFPAQSHQIDICWVQYHFSHTYVTVVSLHDTLCCQLWCHKKKTITAHNTGLILSLHTANERCCYKVRLSLIGWVHAANCDVIKRIKHSAQYRADSRFAPSQFETSLHRNAVSHWLGACSQMWCHKKKANTAHNTGLILGLHLAN